VAFGLDRAPGSLRSLMHTGHVPDRIAPGLVEGSVWTSLSSEPLRSERVVPMGDAQIVFDLDSGRGVLVGLRTVSAIVEPPVRARGVRLSGAGVFAIVGPDVGSTIDRAIDLDKIVDVNVLQRMFDRGVEEPELVALVADLCSRFVPDWRVVAAEQALRRGDSTVSVAQLVQMDRRRFVPLFRRQIGISPKSYEQLIRLARAIVSLRGTADRSLAVLAVQHGYADQAHLTRAVRRFAKSTPGELTRLRGGPPSHLPIDGTTR
jgi:AraC-like DNA-binding protein